MFLIKQESVMCVHNITPIFLQQVSVHFLGFSGSDTSNSEILNVVSFPTDSKSECAGDGIKDKGTTRNRVFSVHQLFSVSVDLIGLSRKRGQFL